MRYASLPLLNKYIILCLWLAAMVLSKGSISAQVMDFKDEKDITVSIDSLADIVMLDTFKLGSFQLNCFGSLGAIFQKRDLMDAYNGVAIDFGGEVEYSIFKRHAFTLGFGFLKLQTSQSVSGYYKEFTSYNNVTRYVQGSGVLSNHNFYHFWRFQYRFHPFQRLPVKLIFQNRYLVLRKTIAEWHSPALRVSEIQQTDEGSKLLKDRIYEDYRNDVWFADEISNSWGFGFSLDLENIELDIVLSQYFLRFADQLFEPDTSYACTVSLKINIYEEQLEIIK